MHAVRLEALPHNCGRVLKTGHQSTIGIRPLGLVGHAEDLDGLDKADAERDVARGQADERPRWQAGNAETGVMCDVWTQRRCGQAGGRVGKCAAHRGW